VAAVALAIHAAPSAGNGSPVERREFGYTKSEQEFEVPAGVSKLTVTAYGARGGYVSGHPNEGGLAGMAKATISVHAGEKLYVEVGGQGGAPGSATCPERVEGDAHSACAFAVGGFNGGQIGSTALVAAGAQGGAGGGGASDVQTKQGIAGTRAGTPEVMSSRLIVAGGGGGMGGLPEPAGSAAPARGGFRQAFAFGGEGDGADGQGNGGAAALDGKGGKQGGASAGGEGGAAGEAEGETPVEHKDTSGGEGFVGEGGVPSASNTLVICEEPNKHCHFVKEAGGGGGGGGGGYYGGGGGGGGRVESEELFYKETAAGGGGGGGVGSSYAPGGESGVAASEVGPNGRLILEWTAETAQETGEREAREARERREREEKETTRQREEREAREAKEAKDREAREARETPKQREERAGKEAKEQVEKEAKGEPTGVEAIIGSEEPPFKVKLGCKGIGAVICKLTVKATVDEEVVNGKIVGVTAANAKGHRHRIHKTVVIGQATVTLSGGQTVAVPVLLNTAGKHLRRTHHTLPAVLEVIQTVGGRPHRTVARERVTIKPAKRAQKHREHLH
jgi:hypothetical protein